MSISRNGRVHSRGFIAKIPKKFDTFVVSNTVSDGYVTSRDRCRHDDYEAYIYILLFSVLF